MVIPGHLETGTSFLPILLSFPPYACLSPGVLPSSFSPHTTHAVPSLLLPTCMPACYILLPHLLFHTAHALPYLRFSHFTYLLLTHLHHTVHTHLTAHTLSLMKKKTSRREAWRRRSFSHYLTASNSLSLLSLFSLFLSPLIAQNRHK